jgi:hypothetical protein
MPQRLRALPVAAIAALALLGIASSAARAADPPSTLWETCHSGPAAGQCRVVRGIAADPSTGHLFAAEDNGRRIDEFTAWGEFVKAWGWGVRTGAASLQTCTTETGCQSGSEGSGAGQMARPMGVALDASGDVYVVDWVNHRVEKFNQAGEFLLAFGGEVNKTTHTDICTAASGDTCGAGLVGAADGEFGDWHLSEGSFIAVGPENSVYVGDVGRIQVFDTAGQHLRNISLPGELVEGLAIDSAANLYVTYEKTAEEGLFRSKDGVRKLSPTGEPICVAAASNPRAIALDADGNLYVVSPAPVALAVLTVRKFDSSCTEAPNFTFTLGAANSAATNSTGIATNVVTEAGAVALYYGNFPEAAGNYIRAFSPPPDRWAPPLIAPDIADQYAATVGTDSAVLRAKINPHFWADTTYYLEYGTGECSKGGCAAKPAAPGKSLTGQQVNEALTGAVVLGDLSPATTYHYRFVAQSSGSGGEAVLGKGGRVGVPGAEGTFTTFPLPSGAGKGCPNPQFRSGAAAGLADCRGYEMVSPVDKNGGDIAVLDGFAVASFNRRVLSRVDQSTPRGDAITYSAARAFAGSQSAPWSSQYMAERGPSGWATTSLNPPLGPISLFTSLNQEIPFRAFSEDLCNSWVLQQTNLTLAPDAPTGLPNLYRRRGCGAGGYETLTNTLAPGFLPINNATPLYRPQIQGSTADGSHSFFRTNGKLTPNAAAGKTNYQLYESSEGGEPTLVSVLPSGKAATLEASLGTGASERQDFHNDSVQGAVSEDGSRVVWTASKGFGASLDEPGEIFLRANPLAAPQSKKGPCAESGKACTLPISGPNSKFWGANPAGSLVVYQTEGPVAGEGKLFVAKIEEEGEALVSHSTQIAAGVEGVIGISTDATDIYFVSTDALSAGATAGVGNIYLYEAGATPAVRYIATLDPSEAAIGYSISTLRSAERHARVSGDGKEAVFVSRASLTGYDNTDAESGEADLEVYLYEAEAQGGAGRLRCISCNPTGARPHGKNLAPGALNFWSAAEIPAWSTIQYAPRALSAAGSRLFFESYDALLPRDTNGAKDVYEWERASGQGACEEMGATLYVPGAGGCLSLISSGESPQGSEFIDASADGRDVFFTTNQSLFPEDPGLVDLYDAREGGGFAPRSHVPSCQGEVCQGPYVPPAEQTPASASFEGAGNSKPGKRHKKGKHKKGKHKKTHHKKHIQHKSRGAQR